MEEVEDERNSSNWVIRKFADVVPALDVKDKHRSF